MSFLFVKIYHGPCNTFDNCIHKPQLLNGIRERLKHVGFRVNLIPVKYINYCMIEMCGHEVFRCNLKHLKFNKCYDGDPVCQKAVEAVVTSAVKFRYARSTLWFWSVVDHQLFRRNKYLPKDYWPVKIDWTEQAPVKECLDCCKIVVQYQKDKDIGECCDEDDYYPCN